MCIETVIRMLIIDIITPAIAKCLGRFDNPAIDRVNPNIEVIKLSIMIIPKKGSKLRDSPMRADINPIVPVLISLGFSLLIDVLFVSILIVFY